MTSSTVGVQAQEIALPKNLRSALATAIWGTLQFAGAFTDLLIHEGHPIRLKSAKGLIKLDQLGLPNGDLVVSADDIKQFFASYVDGLQPGESATRHWDAVVAPLFKQKLAINRSLKTPGDAFLRFSLFQHDRGKIAMVMRVSRPPMPLESIGLNAQVFDRIKNNPRGLLIITGPTASGKTATALSILDWLNQNHSGHVETVEDPIERLHQVPMAESRKRVEKSSTAALRPAFSRYPPRLSSVMPRPCSAQFPVVSSWPLKRAGTAGSQVAAAALAVKLKAMYPDKPFGPVAPTPIAGLFEVSTGDRLSYVDASGTYFLFDGQLVDFKQQVNLTEQRLGVLNKIDASSLPLADAIKIVKGNGQRVLFVFSDPNCPYCKKLETETAVHGSCPSFAHSMPCPPQLRCGCNDRVKAWLDVMVQGATPVPGVCDNPVERNYAMGKRMRVSGTPTIYSMDGRRMVGAAGVTALNAFLDASKVAARQADLGGVIPRSNDTSGLMMGGSGRNRWRSTFFVAPSGLFFGPLGPFAALT